VAELPQRPGLCAHLITYTPGARKIVRGEQTNPKRETASQIFRGQKAIDGNTVRSRIGNEAADSRRTV
jgi:hypothetical protein